MRFALLAGSVFAGAGLLPFSSPARADGNDLLAGCRAVVQALDTDRVPARHGLDGGHCMGFAEGLMVGWQLGTRIGGKELLLCLPADVTAGQIARIWVKYLDAHPEELHKRDAQVGFSALVEAFPCKFKR